MSLSRQMAPPAVALVMFLVCVAIGAGAGWITRRLSHQSPSGTLIVSVRSGQRAMRVQNLSDVSWSGCVVTIEGGMQSQPFAIDPGGVQRVPYDTFLTGTAPLDDVTSGFTRSFHDASVRCRDDAGKWTTASVR